MGERLLLVHPLHGRIESVLVIAMNTNDVRIITDYDVVYVITDDDGSFDTFWNVAIVNENKKRETTNDTR